MTPTTIIFDLGGVILNINYEKTITAFKELGITEFEHFFTQAAQTKLFDRFDTGDISPDEFRQQLRNISGIHLTDQQIDHAWNAMLLDLPPNRIKLLEEVRKNYRTFLLSNTNAIHYPVYMQYMKETYGVESLEALFEKQYLSFELGMRKPNRNIFERVIQENNLSPEKTLFIDDSKQHVHGARQTGLQALWLNVEKNTIASLFNKEHKLKGVVSKMVRA